MRVPEEAATLLHQPRGTVPGHWNVGLLCSSLLWPESPPPTQVGKDTGVSLNLSEGSRRLLTMGLSTTYPARSPRWRETSYGHQLGLSHRGESKLAFQGYLLYCGIPQGLNS